MKTRFMLSICLITMLIYGITSAEPNGAVLYKGATRYGHYNVPGDAGHHYFNYLEGPAWENKYCAFRMYIDQDDRNAIDIMGKYKAEAILQHFSDPSLDPHSAPSWGSDILSVGSAMGLGSFRLHYNGQWLNPQLPENLDSLVITIADSSVETPQVMIGYHGWTIGGGNKITVLWTLSTSLEERATHCELSVIGDYTGKVVAGMVNHGENTNNPNRNTISVTRDEDPPLLATLGKQSSITEGYDDTLLMAIYTDASYFDSFVKQGSTNLGMVLVPDDENTFKWSFAYSWAKEQDPLFRHADWKDQLIPPTTVSRHCFGLCAPPSVKSMPRSADLPATIFTLGGRTVAKRKCTGSFIGNPANGMYILRIDERDHRTDVSPLRVNTVKRGE